MTEEILPAKDDDLSVQVPIASFEDTQYWGEKMSSAHLGKMDVLVVVSILSFLNRTRVAIEREDPVLHESRAETAAKTTEYIHALERLFGRRPMQEESCKHKPIDPSTH
jgi:hypothetical protein